MKNIFGIHTLYDHSLHHEIDAHVKYGGGGSDNRDDSDMDKKKKVEEPMYYILYYSPDESAPPTGGSPLSLNSLLEDELPAPKLLCRLLFSTAVPVVSFVLLVSVVCWLELI